MTVPWGWIVKGIVHLISSSYSKSQESGGNFWKESLKEFGLLPFGYVPEAESFVKRLEGGDNVLESILDPENYFGQLFGKKESIPSYYPTSKQSVGSIQDKTARSVFKNWWKGRDVGQYKHIDADMQVEALWANTKTQKKQNMLMRSGIEDAALSRELALNDKLPFAGVTKILNTVYSLGKGAEAAEADFLSKRSLYRKLNKRSVLNAGFNKTLLTGAAGIQSQATVKKLGLGI